MRRGRHRSHGSSRAARGRADHGGDIRGQRLRLSIFPSSETCLTIRKATPFRAFALCGRHWGDYERRSLSIRLPCADGTGEGYGTKGCAFRILLNPLCAGHSGGALRPFPSREGPRPDGINHSSFFQSESNVQRKRHRADCVRPAETCEKVPAGCFSVRSANSARNAHITDAHSYS